MLQCEFYLQVLHPSFAVPLPAPELRSLQDNTSHKFVVLRLLKLQPSESKVSWIHATYLSLLPSLPILSCGAE